MSAQIDPRSIAAKQKLRENLSKKMLDDYVVEMAKVIQCLVNNDLTTFKEIVNEKNHLIKWIMVLYISITVKGQTEHKNILHLIIDYQNISFLEYFLELVQQLKQEINYRKQTYKTF